jgi:tetratricopeptide (TPR) repeat protein
VTALALQGADASEQLRGMQVRNAELEAQLAAAQAKGGDESRDDAGQRERITLLEHALELSTREIAVLQNAALSQTTVAVPVSSDEDAVLITALHAEVVSLRENYEQSQQALQTARQDLKTVTDELSTLREADTRHAVLYREFEEAAGVIRAQLMEVEKNRSMLVASLEQARSELEKAEAVVVGLQKDKAVSQQSLQVAAERELEYRALLERLVPEVRDLEEKVVGLRQEREALGARLLQREEAIAALQVELEKREHRLARAERVADVLERTRSEVEETQRRQRLNMHYNMAAVYARDRRFAEAEHEYLQALRLDPSDADIHYNLGILYDDELGQREKAILHYRRYLQLNPHGADADRVRGWLMRLEMEARR